MSIINGSSVTGKIILTPGVGTAPPITVIMPPYNEEGLIESYEVVQLRHELIGFNISAPAITQAQQILGYKIRFQCNYNRWISGDALYNKIKVLFDKAKAGWNIEFYPRHDIDERHYTVILANQTLELGINKGGARAQFHRLPVIIFDTVNLETDLKWLPPEVTPEYEQGAGTINLPMEG